MAQELLNKAAEALSAGKPQEALAVLCTVDETFPPRNFFTLKALCLGATGSPQELVPLLTREAQLYPDNKDVFELLSAISAGSGSGVSSVALRILSAIAQRSPSGSAPSRPETPVVMGPDELARIFPGVSFGNSIQVLGIANTSIGEGTCIGDDTWLNVCLRDDQKRLRIGRCVLVGRQSMISTGGSLEIGDYCLFAPRVYISDADHGFQDISSPVLQQPATLNRTLTVEENCWFGINTVISGSITIGRGSVVAANSVVLDDVPPFSVVAGNPACIIKMLNPLTGTWERTRGETDIGPILIAREQRPFAPREEYRKTLQAHAKFDKISDIFTGRGICF